MDRIMKTVRANQPLLFISIVSVLLMTIMSTLWANDVIVTASPSPSLHETTAPNQLTIQDITCSGNTSTSCDFIKNELRLSIGENIDEEEIKNAKIRLSITGLFRSVDISMNKGMQRGSVIVEIQVEESTAYFGEGTTGTIVKDGNYSSSASQYVQGKFGNRNLFGKGKILQASTSFESHISGYDLRSSAVNLKYFDPHLFGTERYFFGSSLSYRSSYINSFSEINSAMAGISRHRISGSISVGRRLADFSFLSAGIATDFYDHTNIADNVYTSQLHGLNAEVFTRYGWSTLDDTVFPRSGSMFAIGIDLDFKNKWYGFEGGFNKIWALGSSSIFDLKLGSPFSMVESDKLGGALSYSFDQTDLKTSLGLGFDLKQNANSDTIRNARFNVSAGFKSIYFGYNSLQGVVSNASVPGARAGLTLDIESFGILNLFALYQRDVR